MARKPSSGIVKPNFPDVQGLASQATASAGEQVKDKVDEAVVAVQHLYGRSAERARGVAGEVDSLISDNPYASLGIGVAAGLLVGVLLGALIAGRD